MPNSSSSIVLVGGAPVKINYPGSVNYALIETLLGAEVIVAGSSTDVTAKQAIDASGSTMKVTNGATFDAQTGAIDYGSSIDIGPNGTFMEGASVSNFGTIFFDGPPAPEKLVIGQGLSHLSRAGDVTGFKFGDTIDFANGMFNGAHYDSSTGKVILTENGTQVGALALSGPDINGSTDFTVVPDGHGGTALGVACFLPDTNILTDKGERPARDIAIGDRLMTPSGEAKPVKWIGRRTYSAQMTAENPHFAPILVKQGALGDNRPHRDLYISPCHALYFDGILVGAGDLVNGVSIIRCAADRSVEYLNFEFAERDMIFAEGAVAETGVVGGAETVYDNWQQYAELYPHEAQELRRKPYTVPRLDCGFAVENIRRAINEHAGIHLADDSELGSLQGWIGRRDLRVLEGVAWNSVSRAPAVLDLIIDGELVGQIVANHYRPRRVVDVHGVGYCGFKVKLPELSPYQRHVVSIRRAADGAELPGSPYMLEAAPELTGTSGEVLVRTLDAAAARSAAELSRTVVLLAAKAETLLQARADLAGQRSVRTAGSMPNGWSEPASSPRMERRAA